MTRPDHIENLSPTDWIVITGFCDEDTDQSNFSKWDDDHEQFNPYMMMYQESRERPDPTRNMAIDGVPYCILAVNAPFIGVTDGKSRKFAIDTRRVHVQRVSQAYAETMNVFTNDWKWEDGKIKVAPPETPTFKTAPTGSSVACPVCGGDTRRRFHLQRGWGFSCKNRQCEGSNAFLPEKPSSPN